MGLPTEKNVENWLCKLGESDEAYASACARLTAKKENLKIEKAKQTGNEGTAIEREKQALTSVGYKQAIDDLVEAEHTKKLLELQRQQYILGIEVWRSLNANMRKS
ncbi:MAG: hypothetical protein CL833_08330 [Crocinitomicaceae bacterium]|nr:hypothetical protein [Crocinitomicaceae bacterium]|tara:strand:- start:587 stop:904 length:318 start_codon:yes stop_codon:yes gene_type:complete